MQHPEHAGAWNDLGACLHEANQPVNAIEALLHAIKLEPSNPQPHNNLGNVLLTLGSFEEAINHYHQALALDPTCADAYSNIGAAWLSRCAYSNAVHYLSEAVRLQPQHPDALAHLGGAFSLLGHPDAESYLQRALALRPGDAAKQVNLALHLLRVGNFEEGWLAYEARWRTPELPPIDVQQPLWLGEAPQNLRGSTGLLHAEQGLGDTLQFLRYLPMVLELGAQVVVEVQPELLQLTRQALAIYPGVIQVIAAGSPRPPFDWHTPLLSLPLAFHTDLHTIPPPLRLAQPRASHPARHSLHVGLVRAGGAQHARDRERSMPLAALEPLFAIANIEFISLQKGTAANQVAESGLSIATPALDDFLQTLEVVDSLDILIGVDTAVVHLAASCGVPTWLLLPLCADWRWASRVELSQGREGSPWYGAVRTYQQRKLPNLANPVESWREVVLRVARDLTDYDTKSNVDGYELYGLAAIHRLYS